MLLRRVGFVAPKSGAPVRSQLARLSTHAAQPKPAWITGEKVFNKNRREDKDTKYVRDRREYQKQFKAVRAQYIKEQTEQKAARLAEQQRQFDELMANKDRLDAEKAERKRLTAIAHGERMEAQFEAQRVRKVTNAAVKAARDAKVKEERKYQLQFLRHERKREWKMKPEDITADDFDVVDGYVPAGFWMKKPTNLNLANTPDVAMYADQDDIAALEAQLAEMEDPKALEAAQNEEIADMKRMAGIDEATHVDSTEGPASLSDALEQLKEPSASEIRKMVKGDPSQSLAVPQRNFLDTVQDFMVLTEGKTEEEIDEIIGLTPAEIDKVWENRDKKMIKEMRGMLSDSDDDLDLLDMHKSLVRGREGYPPLGPPKSARQ